MSAPALEIENLRRVFRHGSREVTALDGVSMSVDMGEIVGLLGHNGAGKTTLAKIVATLLLPSSGDVRVFGLDARRYPRRVQDVTRVVFGGEKGLYDRLTGRQNLRFFGALAGVPRRALRANVAAKLDEVGLGAVADRRVETYSRGMRQRLHLAIGLLSRPRLLILDEPTAGVDPVEAERIRASLRELRSSGVAVLLTTHQLLDVERLADRVLFLEHGRVRYDMQVADFAEQAAFVASVAMSGAGAVPALGAVLSDTDDVIVGPVESDGSGWRIRAEIRTWSSASCQALAAMSSRLGPARIDVTPVRLEDVYVHLASQVDAPISVSIPAAAR